MDELTKIRKLYELKNIDRASSVKDRKESSAEHSWSSLMLADYFMTNFYKHLDRKKVYELLMYHDLIEIETGDNPLHPENGKIDNSKKEAEALPILMRKIPESLKDKFKTLFEEFEESDTDEAKFAKAIDKLDVFIHELDYKHDLKGWNEQFIRDNKEPYLKGFPEMNEVFEEAMDIMRKNRFFEQ